MNRFLLAPAAQRAPKPNNNVEMSPVPQIIIDTIEGIIPELDGNLGELLGVFSLLAQVPERQLAWAGQEVADPAEAFELAILKVRDAKPQGYQILGRVFEYSIRLASIHAVSRAGVEASVNMDDLEWGASWAMESAKTMIEQARTMMAANEHEANLNKVEAAIKEATTISQSQLLRDRRVRHIPARDLAGIIDQLKLSDMIEEFEEKPKVGAKPGGRKTKIFRWTAS